MEFEEGTVLALGAGLSHGATGHGCKELALGQVIQELVEVALERLDGLLEEEEHEERAGPLAVAGEVLGSDPMTGAEERIPQPGAERFAQRDEIGGNALKTCLHPRVAKEGEELVRYKSSIISILHLIQWQWRRGEDGRLPSPIGWERGQGGTSRAARRVHLGHRSQRAYPKVCVRVRS